MKTTRTTIILMWEAAMQGMLVRFLVMSALLACAWPVAFAQQRDIVVPRTEQRVALVIGNGAYKNATPLANPPNDAQLMAETLTTLGFRLVGGAALVNADKPAMENAIREFGRLLRGGAVGLFYYAGHGVQINEKNHLIPVSANIGDEADVQWELVSVESVLDTMRFARNRLNIVILDACRNNPFVGRGVRSVASGLAQVTAPAGTVISYATQPGNLALDGKGARNSPYTTALAAAMRKPGLSVFDTFNEVGLMVKAATGGQQQPWLATSPIEGGFQFVAREQSTGTPQVAMPPADPRADDRALWEAVKDSSNATELQAYLEQFPRGIFAGLARARIKLLTTPKPPLQVATAPSTVPSPAAAAPASTATDFSPGSAFRDCDSCPEMVVIPAGSFTMGSPTSEQGRFDNEGPQHSVNIPSALAVGKHEVTRGEYAQFARETSRASSGCYSLFDGRVQINPSASWQAPGFAQNDSHPVVCVDWNDAKAYAAWLSRKSGRNYRLLSEAEWEYAARAGASTAYYWGDNASNACQYANGVDQTAMTASIGTTNTNQNCADNHVYTAPVGSFQANAFGLHDMTGNAWEWTEDCWNANYNGAPAQGSAWTSGECGKRVLRGGSWFNLARDSRSALRSGYSVAIRSYNFYGFRVARTL